MFLGVRAEARQPDDQFVPRLLPRPRRRRDQRARHVRNGDGRRPAHRRGNRRCRPGPPVRASRRRAWSPSPIISASRSNHSTNVLRRHEHGRSKKGTPMGARTGAQYLDGLRATKRALWIDGDRVEDPTSHPTTRGGGGQPRLDLRPPAHLCRRVPLRRPRNGRVHQREPHDAPLAGRAAVAPIGADPAGRGHRRADGPHARTT